MLETFRESVGEGWGFVEAKTGFWIVRILTRVILDPLEEAIDHAQVEVKVRIQRRAEAGEKNYHH